jgi:hypothetical protein
VKLKLNVGQSNLESEDFSKYKLNLFPSENGNGKKHRKKGNNLYRKRLCSIRRLIS